MGFFRDEYNKIERTYNAKMALADKIEDNAKKAQAQREAEEWLRGKLTEFTPWFNLNSSFLHSCRFRFRSPRLEVVIKNIYIYNVSLDRADGLTAAKHPGRYYDRYIKGGGGGGSSIPAQASGVSYNTISYIDAGKKLNVPANIKKPTAELLKSGILPKDITTAINALTQTGRIPITAPSYISSIINGITKSGTAPNNQTNNSVVGQIFSPVKIALMFAPSTISGPVSAILAAVHIINIVHKMKEDMKKSTAVIKLNS